MDDVMNNCARKIYYLIRCGARAIYHGMKGVRRRETKALQSLHG